MDVVMVLDDMLAAKVLLVVYVVLNDRRRRCSWRFTWNVVKVLLVVYVERGEGALGVLRGRDDGP